MFYIYEHYIRFAYPYHGYGTYLSYKFSLFVSGSSVLLHFRQQLNAVHVHEVINLFL